MQNPLVNRQFKEKKNKNLYKFSLTRLSQSSGRSLAWSRTSACHADDPGSNPGGRTRHFPEKVNLSILHMRFDSNFFEQKGLC
jgi:hypothetical protein